MRLTTSDQKCLSSLFTESISTFSHQRYFHCAWKFLKKWIEGEVVRSTNRQLCIGEVSDIPSLQKWKWIQTHILSKCKICFAAECIFNWLHHKWGCRALLIFLPICQRGLSCHKRGIIIATKKPSTILQASRGAERRRKFLAGGAWGGWRSAGSQILFKQEHLYPVPCELWAGDELNCEKRKSF